LAKKRKLDYVVEKTCANSLRVPFVDAILPEAKYIFIYRDGVDAVGSAIKRWKAKLDIPYLLRKARYVPVSDLPYYGFRYFGNRLYRLFSNEERLALWGPKFQGLDEVLAAYSLEEVCALQWKRCVYLSEEAFLTIPPDKLVRVSYESFVSNPAKELRRILVELDMPFDEEVVKSVTKMISDRSIGKGRKALSGERFNQIHALIADTLIKYGYE